MSGRICKSVGCAKHITDKTRSKFCNDHRGPNTHGIKPSVRLFTEAAPR